MTKCNQRVVSKCNYVYLAIEVRYIWFIIGCRTSLFLSHETSEPVTRDEYLKLRPVSSAHCSGLTVSMGKTNLSLRELCQTILILKHDASDVFRTLRFN